MDRESSRLAADRQVDKWEAIAGFMEDVPLGTLLECGSGTGLYSRRFLEMGYEVTGIDLSGDSIRLAEEHVSRSGLSDRYHAVQGDFLEVVPTLQGEFDAALFVKVLHHLPGEEEIAKALTVAYGKLRPGGCIVGFEPDGASPYWYLNFRIPDLLKGTDRWEYEKNTKLIRREFLRSVFQGFSPESIQFRKRFLLPGSLPGYRRLKLGSVDRFLSNLPLLSPLAGDLLFKVRKPLN